MRVLLIEDDAAIAAPLVEGLQREGWQVAHRGTGGEGIAAAADADLVLLDLGLPDIDGFEVCRRIRGSSDVPIIVLTARGEEVDRVVGLELGADDYVVKPFSLRELVARMRAVARRRVGGTAPPTELRAGRATVDLRTRAATFDGSAIALTPKEFDLLALLASDAGAVFTRERIIDEVWDPHWFGPTKTLDVHVASLRRKLGDADAIETVRGVGYRLRG